MGLLHDGHASPPRIRHPMKVALLGPWPAASAGAAGGVEAVVSTLARGLADVPGVDVHVLALGPRVQTTQQGSLTVHELGMQRAFRNLTLSILDRRRLVHAVRALRPDVVHAHGLPDYGYAAVNAGFPSLVTVHGVAADEA